MTREPSRQTLRRDAWHNALRFREERQHRYQHLFVEAQCITEAPTVQVWFQVRLDNHDDVDDLLQRIDQVLQPFPGVYQKEDL